MSIALGLIAKDEVKEFEEMLTKYGQYFDEIVVAVDYNIGEFRHLADSHKNCKIYEYNWRDDFSHKRNFVAERIESDYYFRMDMDDEIIQPELIPEIVEKLAKHDITVGYCYYDYAVDQDGNTNAAQWREVFIKNTDTIYWNKPIHENILPKEGTDYKPLMVDTLRLKHNADFEHAVASMERNVKYLIDEYNEDKENTDPRTIAYLGRTFYALQDFDKAIFFLQKHIELSGWDEDRYMSWCSLADIFNKKGDYDTAIASAFEALQERPAYPDAYFKLHDIYFQKQDWERAIFWGEEGTKRPQPKTFMLLDPSSYTWRPALSLSFCYLQKDRIDDAYKSFTYAKRLAPNLDWVKDNEEMFETAKEQKDYLERFMWLLKYTEDKDATKCIELFDGVPANMYKHPVMSMLRNKFAKPKVWGDKSIVIFCGTTPEAWSPDSVATGLGGSEEAVVYIAQSFKRLGYDVTIYNQCEEKEGVYDGINYINNYKFTDKDEFNILFSWRSNIFTGPIKAKTKLIWLHDVIFPGQFKPGDQDTFDKVLVLSEYHKTMLPDYIPEDQIVVTSNGINADDFTPKGVERNIARCIYSSSYDRGLEALLDRWGDVKKEVPEAELHIYYGWQTYDKLRATGQRPGSFKEDIELLMNQDGVYEHGRIGHDQLNEEMQRSAILAYPCTFEEINCITLTKAIANGCLPVTSDYAAVGERNKEGIAVGLDNYTTALTTALKNKVKINCDKDQYIKDNSWDTIAKQWTKLF